MPFFHASVRRQRQLVFEFEFEAPSGNAAAARQLVRDVMRARGQLGRCRWVVISQPSKRLEFFPADWQPLVTVTQDGHEIAIPMETPRRLRDSQRAAVYLADSSLFPPSCHRVIGAGIEQRVFLSPGEAQTYLTRLCRDYNVQPITFKTSKARGGKARSGSRSITMPSWTWFEQYLLHEFAHLLVGDRLGQEYWFKTKYESHGPEFVATLYVLIRDNMGDDAALAYVDACSQHGVRMGPRSEVDRAHNLPLAAGPQDAPQPSQGLTSAEQGYIESYRKYRRGQRSSAPSLRKNMTKQRGAELRATVDNEVL